MAEDCNMLVCNCKGDVWDPSKWVFSHLHRGGWFCLNCMTQLGYFREGFTGEEEWRPKPAPIPETPVTPPKAKKGLWSRLKRIVA